MFSISTEHAYPARQSIAGNAAEGKELINAGAERSTPEVGVEIVWKEIQGRTAVLSLRPLRYLVKSHQVRSLSEDRLDPFCKVRSKLQLLPAACWHVLSERPSCGNFRFASILGRPCTSGKVGAWFWTIPQGAVPLVPLGLVTQVDFWVPERRIMEMVIIVSMTVTMS